MEIADADTHTLLLMRLIDAVERLTGITSAKAGKRYKPKQVQMAPTGIDRARERKRQREGNRLFDLFTSPRKGE